MEKSPSFPCLLFHVWLAFLKWFENIHVYRNKLGKLKPPLRYDMARISWRGDVVLGYGQSSRPRHSTIRSYKSHIMMEPS
jgi:hypothetical protein